LQVTEGQPRVVLHLDRPAAARATIRVTAERAGQLLPVEEVKLKNPHTVMVTLPVCLMAKSCLGKHCCGHHNFLLKVWWQLPIFLFVLSFLVHTFIITFIQ
jgi:hypothetical protein